MITKGHVWSLINNFVDFILLWFHIVAKDFFFLGHDIIKIIM